MVLIFGYKYLSFIAAPTGCTDPLASNYDAMAVCDDGSCCYSTSSVLQIFTNAQNGNSQYRLGVRDALMIFSMLLVEDRKQGRRVIRIMMLSSNEADSCAAYELVLRDNAYNGWNSSLPATALITSASGICIFEAGGSYFGYKYLSFIAAPTGCTDPLASNYDAMAVCDEMVLVVIVLLLSYRYLPMLKMVIHKIWAG